MGGKGGGDDVPGWYPAWQAEQARLAKEKAAADAAASAKATADAAAGAQKTVDDAKVTAATPAAADAPAVTATVAPPANDTLAPPSVVGGDTTAEPDTPISGGSAIETAGDTLGGSVLNPPKYWTGTMAKYKTAPAGQAKKGSMSTTQT